MRPEDIIHRAVVKELEARKAPGVLFWHTPNQGKRRRWAASALKGLGMKLGVSDLCFLHRGKFYALELKADDGRPTVEQMQFISDVNAAGGYGCIAEGLDQAICVLETWGLLRKDRSDVRAAA